MTTMQNNLPSLLIISFSPITSDARVLKQIKAARKHYAVSTMGDGPAPEGVVRHIRVTPPKSDKLWQVLCALRMYKIAHYSQPLIRQAKKLSKGLEYDLILANELESLPLAVSMKPRWGIHCDLHEFYQSMYEENPIWKRRISPYYQYLCRNYLPKASSVSAVVEEAAARYHEEYGIPVSVVRNATPFANLEPTPVHEPVRLVHSGIAQRQRNIPALVAAVAALDGYSLDLYLTKNDPGHWAEIRELAAATPGVRLHEPVPYDQLISTLNQHDLGLFLLPPINYHYATTLPNKIYDYMQARLGAIVSPTPPAMSRLVEQCQFGCTTDGYDSESLIRTLRSLTPEKIAAYKNAAHEHARAHSADAEVSKWIDALKELESRH